MMASVQWSVWWLQKSYTGFVVSFTFNELLYPWEEREQRNSMAAGRKAVDPWMVEKCAHTDAMDRWT